MFDHFIMVYLPYIVVTIDVFYHWLLSKGELKKAYKLSILMFLGFMVVETGLALRNPEQIHMIVYILSTTYRLGLGRYYDRLRFNRDHYIYSTPNALEAT